MRNWELLVSLSQIKLQLSIAEGSKQVFNLGHRVAVQLHHWVKCHLEVSAKSHTLLVDFSTATTGVAQAERVTGSNVPSATKRSISASTFCRRAKGTLQYQGLTLGSTSILALRPLKVPKPS